MKPAIAEKRRLLRWYEEGMRPLPWRKTEDPYKIWISETMLQQTTATAVIPYYKRFVKRFPTVKALASASLEEVYEYWAGLGYYSRARNLHKAAIELHGLKSFPQSHSELLELPGFGPYTARAVASIAFDEPVGVVDGNTIRFISRHENIGYKWWTTKDRSLLQQKVDDWVHNQSPKNMNQALMELGATICLPKNPQCLLCPVQRSCQSLKLSDPLSLPLKKPRRAKEIWRWEAHLVTKNQRLALVKNTYSPFLKNQWFLPGKAEQIQTKPKTVDFRHNITHHEIFVTVKTKDSRILQRYKDVKWVPLDEVKQTVPFSLVDKVLSIK